MGKHSKLGTISSAAAEPKLTLNIRDTNYTNVTENHLYTYTISISSLTDESGQRIFSLSKMNTQLAGIFLNYNQQDTELLYSQDKAEK